MDPKPTLFVSGMFRSGTTLVARMLNAHPTIALASDPFRPLFNSLRYAIAPEAFRAELARFDPLGDYFDSQLPLLQAILDSDLEIELDLEITELEQRIRDHAGPYSGLWADALSIPTSSRTYGDVISYCLELVDQVYGAERNKNTSLVGLKEVWTNEFAPAIFRSLPESKALFVVRDPRAVVASKNVTDAKYPVIFMARQWRKLAFLAHHIQQQWPERCMVIRYEDLVQNQIPTLNALCDFLGEPFSDALVDGTTYVDGRNQPWRQNTSYRGAGKGKVNAGSLERWKQALETSAVQVVETICCDWMEACGYQPTQPRETLLDGRIDSFPAIPEEQIANWMRPFAFEQNEEQLTQQMQREHERLSVLGGDYDSDTAFALQLADGSTP